MLLNMRNYTFLIIIVTDVTFSVNNNKKFN